MKIGYAVVVFLAICALSARPQQTLEPLTKGQVTDLVKSGMEAGELAKLIRDHGINFDLTDDYLQALRTAGAQEPVLEALRAARPKPLTRQQVLQLVGGHVPNERAAALVKQRGIDFPADEEFLQTLRLAGADEEVIAALRDATKQVVAEVTVATSPGAKIYLDGELRGNAGPQGEFSLSAKPGSHALKVTLEGKKDFEQTISVAGGSTNKLTATLNDLPGRILVKTSSGVEVFLDGMSRGKTDGTGKLLLADVTAGNHAVRLAAHGKEDYQQSVAVAAGKESAVTHALEDMPGSLHVRTTPNALIFLDNIQEGRADANGEFVKDGVRSGSYVVGITAKDKREIRRPIVISAGEVTKVEEMLADLPVTADVPKPGRRGGYGGGGASGKRLEGLFQNESADPSAFQIRYLLRFYPDGAVIGAAVTAIPSDLDDWFHEGWENSGTYQTQGSSIKFSLTDKNGTVDYSGRIQGGTLILDWISHINNKQGHEVYHLLRK
jgi:hypothetical protein